uniref:Uncharacterized protein n=1 Tax=Caenorhabditis japonica TaxID=281687 RepID=A0A8R1IGN0_CAEJA
MRHGPFSVCDPTILYLGPLSKMLIISKALLFLSFFHLVTASGYLEMSFKSDFHLKAVINITTADTPLLIPFTVSPNETETLPRIPINFVGIEEYRLTIFVINEDKQEEEKKNEESFGEEEDEDDDDTDKRKQKKVKTTEIEEKKDEKIVKLSKKERRKETLKARKTDEQKRRAGEAILNSR